MSRKITFTNVGIIKGSRVWRNSETGVEIIKGANFVEVGLYYVCEPAQGSAGRQMVQHFTTLAKARAAAKVQAMHWRSNIALDADMSRDLRIERAQRAEITSEDRIVFQVTESGRQKIDQVRARLTPTISGEMADDPTPVSPARGGAPHVVAMTNGGLVDETPAEPVTVYFSFGHGQTDPDSGKDLLDHYVTIIGPSYEACREAMFASKYGERWAFEYPDDSPATAEWIPQWTEHDRIVLADGKPVSESR